jgi:hypothetical protein
VESTRHHLFSSARFSDEQYCTVTRCNQRNLADHVPIRAALANDDSGAVRLANLFAKVADLIAQLPPLLDKLPQSLAVLLDSL